MDLLRLSLLFALNALALAGMAVIGLQPRTV